MTFRGWVPIRRTILGRTMSGELTLHEFAALTALILLADHRTGSGKINGPVLRTYLPGFSEDASKRVLRSLEEKGYIFRAIIPRSPLVYPYFVDGFSVGRLQLSITKALTSRRQEDIEYLPAALEGALESAPDSAPEGALEGAHGTAQYNKKDKDKKKKNEKDTPYPVQDGLAKSDLDLETETSERSEKDIEPGGERRVAREGVPDGDTATPVPGLPDFVFRNGNYYRASDDLLVDALMMRALIQMKGGACATVARTKD